MSKSKGFSDTAAGRYSLALYELASEANVLSDVEDHSLSFINLIASSEDFKSLIKNPTNSKDDQLNALRKISEQNKLNDLLTKFLSFLVSKRRFFYVDNILKSFVETCSAKRGELKAELTSAKELTEEDIDLSEILLLKDGHCFRDGILNLCQANKKLDLSHFQIQSGSFETLLNLSDEGLGMTLLPYLNSYL